MSYNKDTKVINSAGSPGAIEGGDLDSTGQPIDKILVTDGSNGFIYEDKPAGGGGGTLSHARIIKSGSTSIVNTGTSNLTWSSEDVDVDDIVDISTNDRIKINSDGKYILNATLLFRDTTITVGDNFSVFLEVFDASGALVSSNRAFQRIFNNTAAVVWLESTSISRVVDVLTDYTVRLSIVTNMGSGTFQFRDQSYIEIVKIG